MNDKAIWPISHYTEHHARSNHEKKILTRGFQPNANTCYLYTRPFDVDRVKSTYEFILFRCGHTYHRNCLQVSVGFDEELMS